MIYAETIWVYMHKNGICWSVFRLCCAGDTNISSLAVMVRFLPRIPLIYYDFYGQIHISYDVTGDSYEYVCKWLYPWVLVLWCDSIIGCLPENSHFWDNCIFYANFVLNGAIHLTITNVKRSSLVLKKVTTWLSIRFCICCPWVI